MNLKKAALLAGIIGGIAVLITLVALLLEVRENTNIIRVSAYDRNIDSLNEWRMNISQSAELSQLYQAYVSGRSSDLTRDQEFRLLLIVNQSWGIYEKSYYANQYGMLGSPEWNRFLSQMCMSYQQIGNFPSERSQRLAIDFLTEEFHEFLDATCQ